jgi:hypothetical protein
VPCGWSSLVGPLAPDGQVNLADALVAPDMLQPHATNGPVLPMHFRKDNVTLKLITTIATLSTPQDITLQELRIESFFPMDRETRQYCAVGHDRSRRPLCPRGCTPAAQCSKFTLQRPRLLEPSGDVAQDCRDTHHPAVVAAKWYDSEFDGDARAALAQCRHREDLTSTVSTFPSAHGGIEPLPVALSQALRNDQIQRLADCLGLSEAEYARRSRIPEPDQALVVGVDNGVSRTCNQFSTEVGKIKAHGLAYRMRVIEQPDTAGIAG